MRYALTSELLSLAALNVAPQHNAQLSDSDTFFWDHADYGVHIPNNDDTSLDLLASLHDFFGMLADPCGHAQAAHIGTRQPSGDFAIFTFTPIGD